MKIIFNLIYDGKKIGTSQAITNILPVHNQFVHLKDFQGLITVESENEFNINYTAPNFMMRQIIPVVYDEKYCHNPSFIYPVFSDFNDDFEKIVAGHESSLRMDYRFYLNRKRMTAEIEKAGIENILNSEVDDDLPY